MVAGAILGAGLVGGGMLIQTGVLREAGAAPSASSRLLDQVMARVLNDWIDTISAEELYKRAASGVVKEVDDPYSTLLTRDRLRRLRESTTGRYAGVGLELDIRDGFVTVIAPISRTPADSAGVKPGDRIIAIDGKPTLGLSMEEAHQLMRGATGTIVRLTIERGTADTTIALRRREIVYHPVQRAELINGAIGYLELAAFNERAAREVRRGVDSLRERGARSLILDVRENPGGLLEQGLAVADLFLDAGLTIASTRGRIPEANQVFKDETGQLWPGMPVVVLVDSGTASAAEIVAGALQDHKRGVVVGSPTYGKGSAQSVFPLPDDLALKLTTARWFTPKGRTIARDSTNGGITPDVEVRKPEMPVVASGRLGTPTPPRVLLSDPVIARAVEMMHGVLTPEQLNSRIPKPGRGMRD
jgi:carboxyl-terminal processing protease